MQACWAASFSQVWTGHVGLPSVHCPLNWELVGVQGQSDVGDTAPMDFIIPQGNGATGREIHNRVQRRAALRGLEVASVFRVFLYSRGCPEGPGLQLCLCKAGKQQLSWLGL